MLAVVTLSPLPLSPFLHSFKCFLGRESGVSSGSGHLDVERARWSVNHSSIPSQPDLALAHNLGEDLLSPHTARWRGAPRAASAQGSRWQMGQSLRGQLSSDRIRQTWQWELRRTFLVTDTFQMSWWILECGPWASGRDYEERRASRSRSTPSEPGFHGQTGVRHAVSM